MPQPLNCVPGRIRRSRTVTGPTRRASSIFDVVIRQQLLAFPAFPSFLLSHSSHFSLGALHPFASCDDRLPWLILKVGQTHRPVQTTRRKLCTLASMLRFRFISRAPSRSRLSSMQRCSSTRVSSLGLFEPGKCVRCSRITHRGL